MSELPPTEDLFMEVLAARARLGETWWTFGTNTRKTAKSLEAKGLIDTMHGVVERTFRARLTDKGAKDVLASNYTPPIYADVKAALAKLDGTRKAAVALLSGLPSYEIDGLGGVREQGSGDL